MTQPVRTIRHKKRLEYRCSSDEEIDVILWSRWPSYDFIFGIPTKRNKFYGEEYGFFQYRDTRHKKVHEGFYVDLEELRILSRGFERLFKLAIEASKGAKQ